MKDYEFNLGLEYSVPELPGVYLIQEQSSPYVLYIGRTNNLRTRFKRHLKKTHNWRLKKNISGNSNVSFSYEITISTKEMKQKEKDYIQRYNPVYNEIRYQE
ncbi:GIY-YIG nuclease family protein [Paenibacillus sp. DP01]|uniref:GIY-YIG nuclease family protein n=1 Tax=Paenibacillus sp. DP01 TaxID=3373096 RepID=UPI00385039EF